MSPTKEEALALIPEAKLERLKAQLAFSRERVQPRLCGYFRDMEYHEWLIPLLEAEIERRKAVKP